MPRRRRLAVVGVASLLLVGACSVDGTTATDGPDGTGASTPSEGEATVEPAEADVASGSCVSAYLPIAEGNTWTYELSEPAGTVYTDTVTALGDEGFTISSDFDELTKRTEWACTDEGITALTYGSGPAASLSVGGLEGSFETTDVSGVTLPADLSSGDRWRQMFDISGRFDAGGVQTRVTGSVIYALRAGDVEAVEVPAGTFDAIAIDTDITLDLTPSTGGVGIPLTLNLDGVQWFAEGVGLVRSESDGDFFGASFSSVAELTSYDVG